MSRIFLVRHAETDLKGTFCGHTDPCLNDAGRAQLPAILEQIGNTAIELVLSSDLRRAIETATPIAGTFEVPLLLRPGLREIYFGEWEGLTWQQIEARDPEFARKWHEEFPHVAIPGGELLSDFEERIAAEMDYLQMLPAESTTVVVTHGGVLRNMVRAIGNASQEEIPYGKVIQYSL